MTFIKQLCFHRTDIDKTIASLFMIYLPKAWKSIFPLRITRKRRNDMSTIVLFWLLQLQNKGAIKKYPKFQYARMGEE